MAVFEYNCENSTSIERIAYDTDKFALFVIFRSSNKIYKYLNINLPNIETLLIGNCSKGKLISEIKKDDTIFLKLNSFPRNTKLITSNTNLSKTKKKEEQPISHKNKKKHFKRKYHDYSNEWLSVLENKNNILNRDYLDSLIQLLNDKCSQYYPPNIKPFELTNHDLNANVHSSINDNSITHFNHYSNLSNDDDDEDDITLSSIEKSNPINNQQLKNPVIRTIQVRYLKLKIICALVENYRAESQQNLMNKEYHLVIQNWTYAHQCLLNYQELIDQWLAIQIWSNEYASNNMNPPHLPDKHNFKQLTELLQGIEILINDTEYHKNKIIKYSINLIKKIENKLNPMLHDRNIIKNKIGEDKWINNPFPKNNFSEKRKLLENELLNIHEVIDKISLLNFNIFV